MATNDDLWIPASDAWGLDRFAWEEDEERFPIDLDEPVETLGDRRD